MRAFMCLFMDYYVQGYLWTLTPTNKPPIDDDKGFPWRSFIQTAKVRFNCPVIKLSIYKYFLQSQLIIPSLILKQERHGWTTMQGRVAFWYRIAYTKPGLGNFIRGQVVFKLYGQKCETCSSDVSCLSHHLLSSYTLTESVSINLQNYEIPLWYPEEIANAIWNLYFKIGQKLFGLPGCGVVRGLRGVISNS